MMIAGDNTTWLSRLRGAPLPVLLTLHTGVRLDQAQLVRATSLKPQTVREALSLLEMHGLVIPLRDGRWVISQQGEELVRQLQRRRSG
jgi:DNA-binding GntR family transcriptional regulator